MKNRITTKLYGFDLLNENRGISRVAGDTYIEEAISNSIQQYFMFSMIYKLSSFNPTQNMGPMGIMGGGRRS
jgi:hypothetical protein